MRYNGKISVAIILVMCLLCAGCDCIESGKVVQKEYQPARHWMTIVFVNKMAIPVWHHIPPKWIVTIEGSYRDSKKVGKRDVYVSEGAYNNYKIGDTISLK